MGQWLSPHPGLRWYEVYSSGGPRFGDGGSHQAPCRRPTGTTQGWVALPISTTARAAIVMGVAELRGKQNIRRCGAPWGEGEASRTPAPRSVPRLEH